ncbi:hypothetical protein F4778DRAFT_751613 [Xylariomycetidae sp. FL2044]|nr:hypothetical protein F4778DRAFT_751613 [Xylariomycetidae sp. FL2044]
MSVDLPLTCPVLQAPLCPILHGDGTMSSVFEPVDPAIYDEVYPENPKDHIREVADLMTEWYNLFIDMRYINAEDVAFPPHRHLPIDLTKPAALGLTKDVVDLYQMLPYYLEQPNWNYGSDHGEFLMWGEFLKDMRGPDADWWKTAGDPFYAIEDMSPWDSPSDSAKDGPAKDWDDEDGPYMRPWFATLTDCGNHGSIMVLDTKTNRMWFIDQLGGTNDPQLKQTSQSPRETQNMNDLEQYPSRPAPVFLRDMINRFKTLEWIPGGLYEPREKYYGSFKALYKECGWPKKFNPLLFESKRYSGGKKYSYSKPSPKPTAKEESYRALKSLVDALAHARETCQQQIHKVDATYKLEHKLYAEKWQRQRLEGQLSNAEDVLDGMRRWDEELAELRRELDFLRADLEHLRDRTGRYAGPGWAGVSDDEVRRLYRDTAQSSGDKIATTEAKLKDADMQARRAREYREAKKAAAQTPKAAWDAMAKDYAKWENDKWEDRWSILGSGTTVVDLKMVLEEDLSLEELQSRIVYELEKNEDRSWRGERLWRNDGGRVAPVLSH